jgi:O-antigen ligase
MNRNSLNYSLSINLNVYLYMQTSLRIAHQNQNEKWIDILLWLTLTIVPVAILPIKVPDIFDAIKGPILIVFGLTILVLLFINNKWDKSLITWLLCGYLLLVLMSSTFAYNPLLAFAGVTMSGGRFEGFATIFIYGILFYASRNHLKFSKKKLIWSFSLLSLVAIYSLIQYYQFDPLVIYRRFRPMVFSTIGNQNFLASLMVMLTVITLGFSVLYKKWYCFILFVLFFSSLLVAQTRSGWIAFGFVFILMSVYFLSFKKEYLISYSVSIATMIFVYFLLNYTKNNILQKRSNTIKKEISLSDEYGGSGRLKIWEITWHVIQDHPIFGTGPENLKSIVHKEHKKEIDEYYRVKRTSFDKAHNEFLHIAAVSGIPSLIIYLSILILIFKENLKKMRQDKIHFIVAIAVLGYLIQAFFNISVIAVAPVYWIFLGFISQKTKGVY